MGEAKRRKALGGQVESDLRRRLEQGDFGAPGACAACCIVVDRSVAGRDLLRVLRQSSGWGALHAVLEGEDLALWQASPLFAYAVVAGGNRVAAPRVWLAADQGRLLGSALPQALAVLPRPFGSVLAVEGAAQAAVRDALARTG